MVHAGVAPAAAPAHVLHASPAGTAWDTHYTRNGNFSVAEVLNSVGFDAMVGPASLLEPGR